MEVLYWFLVPGSWFPHLVLNNVDPTKLETQKPETRNENLMQLAFSKQPKYQNENKYCGNDPTTEFVSSGPSQPAS
jgi:hypothetical protein